MSRFRASLTAVLLVAPLTLTACSGGDVDADAPNVEVTPGDLDVDAPEVDAPDVDVDADVEGEEDGDGDAGPDESPAPN